MSAFLFTPMFYFYILQSDSTGLYYIGQTDIFDRRLSEHNDLANTISKTTKRFKGPWKLVYLEKYQN